MSEIAELRRQRKLERERFQEETRRRLELERLQHESELKRQDDERRENMLRITRMNTQLRLAREAEQSRIAQIEETERKLIEKLEHQLSLLGAYDIAELPLSSPNITALAVAFLPLRSLDRPIPALEDDVVFISASDGMVHAHSTTRGFRLFTFGSAWAVDGLESAEETEREDTPLRFQGAESLCITPNGFFIVCEQDAHRIQVFDLRTLLISHSAASALVAVFGENGSAKGQFSRPSGLASDQTSDELFVTDSMNHRVEVFRCGLLAEGGQKRFDPSRPSELYAFVHAFGRRGNGDGCLFKPKGLGLSHYHVVVCDSGNSRLAVFTRKGVFVRTFGQKGSEMGCFAEPVDVKVVNVRKASTVSADDRFRLAHVAHHAVVSQKALLRGAAITTERDITNEQFEILVADLGNFRIQMLNESGEFLRQFTTLSDVEQLVSHKDQLHVRSACLMHELALFPSQEYHVERRQHHKSSPLVLSTSLAKYINPNTSLYARITNLEHEIQTIRSRLHHPSSLSYDAATRVLHVVDRENAKLRFYNCDGSRCHWIGMHQLRAHDNPVSNIHMMSSVSMVISSAVYVAPDDLARNTRNGSTRFGGDQSETWKPHLFVSDPRAHRVAVLDAETHKLKYTIGASSYGDQIDCANGFLPGELDSPSGLALFHKRSTSMDLTHCHHASSSQNDPQTNEERLVLVVANNGNHTITFFDAEKRTFLASIGRLGHEIGFFHGPQGVAVLENKLLFIVDQLNHRVQVFDLLSNEFRLCFGKNGNKPGQFSFPHGIAVCSALPSMNKCNFGPMRGARVVVSDTGNHRVQMFGVDGQLLRVISDPSDTLQFRMTPLGVFIEPRSALFFVCDAQNKSILLFRNDGSFCESLAANVEPENRLRRPQAIWLTRNAARMRVYITDTERLDVCFYDL